MDKTTEYIKMCSKAEEIQKIWTDMENRNGSRHWSGISSGHCIWMNALGSSIEETIWLPRQDQLQKIVWDIQSSRGLLIEFHDFVKEYWSDYLWQMSETTTSSMEQLWLAFVMDKKYQKKWDGIEWVRDEDAD